MSRCGKKVPGFCYVTRAEVALTPAEWRAKYPPPAVERRVGGSLPAGETHYYIRGHRVAEAYAIIPEGK